MYSRCPERRAPVAAVAGACLAALAWCAAGVDARVLRVCADPDNLPYSREDGSGYENAIARVVAGEMAAELRYAWLPHKRAWVRKSMGEGLCDVFIGVPKGFDPVLTTQAYYRSTYVFVQRSVDRPVVSFADPRLASARIGIQLIGDDLATSPPGHVLARRRLVDNVVGYPVIGDGPAARRIVDALAAGDIDVAVVWGPQAAYFASRSPVPLTLAVSRAPEELPSVRFEYAIAMGVRKGDVALRDELDRIIDRRRPDLDAILARFGVPRTESPARHQP